MAILPASSSPATWRAGWATFPCSSSSRVDAPAQRDGRRPGERAPSPQHPPARGGAGTVAGERIGAPVLHVAPLDDADVEHVVAAAEGNALLAVERARAVATGWREAPPSLRAAVRAGLAPLSPEPRLLAELVAAAELALERAEVDALPIGAPAETATAALGTGLLVADGSRLGFRHALLREAAYADIPEPRRAWLHERPAAALAGTEANPGAAAEVARHLQLAGRPDRAADHLVRAAAQRGRSARSKSPSRSYARR